MKKIQVGLIGFGTVGSGLAQTLYEQKDRLQRKVGAEVVLSQVADIMTDSLPDELARMAQEAGAYGCLTKPFDLDEVTRTLEKILAVTKTI